MLQKEYAPSESLAALVGNTPVCPPLTDSLCILANAVQLSRPQVVKKLWEYIKANDLQNPADKRQIFCDNKMAHVFKQDTVHMFTMNKLLGKHLYEAEAPSNDAAEETS